MYRFYAKITSIIYSVKRDTLDSCTQPVPESFVEPAVVRLPNPHDEPTVVAIRDRLYAVVPY